MKNQLTLNGLNESIAYCEAEGLSICFQAYAYNCPGEYIFEIGFNEKSGYTYIALEGNITICSLLANDALFLVTDFDNGKETFFNTYDEAVQHLETLNA